MRIHRVRICPMIRLSLERMMSRSPGCSFTFQRLALKQLRLMTPMGAISGNTLSQLGASRPPQCPRWTDMR